MIKNISFFSGFTLKNSENPAYIKIEYRRYSIKCINLSHIFFVMKGNGLDKEEKKIIRREYRKMGIKNLIFLALSIGEKLHKKSKNYNREEKI